MYLSQQHDTMTNPFGKTIIAFYQRKYKNATEIINIPKISCYYFKDLFFKKTNL